jgi:Icc-related predicted phosphoesterase
MGRTGDISIDEAVEFRHAPPSSMRLLFVADLHYALKQIDWLLANAAQFDPVIIGGDLLDLAGVLEKDVQIVVMEKYLRRLSERTRLLVSSGNHDGDARNSADESVARWLQEAKGHGYFTDGDSVEVDGTLYSICPWWDGPVSRAELEAQLARDAARPKARWIWIHHAPPARSPVSWTGRKSGGDEILAEWIQRYQPDVVFSGHIHNAPFVRDGAWIDRLGRTWVLNPGRQIGPKPTFATLDLDTMTAEWFSIEGEGTRQLGTAPLAIAPPAAAGA